MSLVGYIEENYKFVLIRSPYELMDNPLVQNIFPKIIRFKTEGYRKEYGNFVLPFDSSDFIASHLLLCEEKNGQLMPVLGFKSVTLKACDDHRITFPMLNLLDAPLRAIHYQTEIKRILQNYREKNLAHKVAYNGSFTISPHLRKDKELMKYFWDITFSLLNNYYITYDIHHVLALCVTKFHVNKRKEHVGWEYIKNNDSFLSPYVSRTFFDTELVPMELKNISVRGKEAAMKFSSMWHDRLILDLEHFKTEKEAA